MPTSITLDPFNGSKVDITLRIPQARVLTVLLPTQKNRPQFEWPFMTHRMISRKLGSSEQAEYVRRALRGLKEGSKSGTPHLGLVDRGYVIESIVDIVGISEANYQITPIGIIALDMYIREHGDLPPLRSASSCINNRYKNKSL